MEHAGQDIIQGFLEEAKVSESSRYTHERNLIAFQRWVEDSADKMEALTLADTQGYVTGLVWAGRRMGRRRDS